MTNQLTDVGSGEGFDVLFGDETDEWPEQATSKGFRASWFITVFSALLLLMAGLWLGAYLQRGQASTSTTSLSSLFGSGASGATGASALAKAAAKSTTGTVTDIEGHTLYVTTSSGSLVAV